MGRGTTTFVAAGIAALLGGAAHAGLITLDPDDFATGTVLNNAWDNVTMTALGDGLQNDNVLVLESAFASTGTRVFGHTGGSPTSWGNGTFEFLRVDFANGTNQVSLDFIADDATDDNGFLNAYNAGGDLVDSAGTGLANEGEIVTLTVSHPDIAYVTAEGDPINLIDNWTLDRMTYMPGPGAIAAFALAGLVTGRRRRS